MSDQWGRGGSGAAPRRSGTGAILFTALVSLGVGIAGGYGLVRVMGPANEDEISARDARIADLSRELENRAREAEESAREAETLAARKAELEGEVARLRSGASAPDPDSAAAATEFVRLRDEVVPGLEKQAKLAAQRVADAEALKRRAEEAVRDRERRITLQSDQIDRLEKTLDALRAGQENARSDETERLEAEADTLREQLEAARAETQALRDGELAGLGEAVRRKEAEVTALQAERAQLTARVAALEAAAAETHAAGENSGQPPRDNDKPQQEGRSPRNAALVARALQDTPGLDRLSGAQRDQLERTLVSGECVTNALGAVFSRVPVLAMRNLMRDLDSDC